MKLFKNVKNAVDIIKENVITKNDIVKFYMLLNHYNITSPNIAVIGTKKDFEIYIKKIMQKYKNKKGAFARILHDKAIIIYNEIETTYINIQKTSDLCEEKTSRSLYFRRFIIV